MGYVRQCNDAEFRELMQALFNARIAAMSVGEGSVEGLDYIDRLEVFREELAKV